MGTLMSAVSEQPVAISVQADMWWQFYQSGVLPTGTCSGDTNHAVLLVGYSPANDSRYSSYFIVRNSWGQTWGQDGYVYVPTKPHFQPESPASIFSPYCVLALPAAMPVV